jgi:hypothetical protein
VPFEPVVESTTLAPEHTLWLAVTVPAFEGVLTVIVPKPEVVAAVQDPLVTLAL